MADQQPPRLGPVVPVLAQRRQFVPTAGRLMSVHLPGEVVMAKVLEMTSDDVAVVEITGVVTRSASHGVHGKDHIAVQRTIGELEIEIWTPISEREVTMRETARRLAHAEAERRQAEAVPVVTPIAEILPPEPKKPVRKRGSKGLTAMRAEPKRKDGRA